MRPRTLAAVAAIALLFAFQQLQIRTLKRTASGERGAASAAGAERGGDARDAGDLARRVEALEERVQRLGRVAIEQSRSSGGPASADLEALRRDVEDLVVERAFESDAGRERLRAAIRREQDAADEERRRERMERFRKEQDARIARFIEEARLSEKQAEAVVATMDDERERIGSVFQVVREGAKPFYEAREQVRGIRQETDSAIEATLDRDQYAAYRAMRDEMRGGFGGPPP